MMKAIKIIVTLLTVCLFFPIPSEARGNECVILLHGLGRTHHSMSTLESFLEKQHYIVVNENYPSTRKSIQELANIYIPSMVNKCLKYHPKNIHFVTHSLGGIILQRYLQKHTIPEISHIVMLGPPNHGSPLVDLLQKNGLLKFILGPAVDELSTKDKSPPLIQGSYKIGIIAGNYNLNPFAFLFFREPNDGKVAVSSTYLDQMADFILLPVTHTFMMRNTLVEKQILCFLNHGHFNRNVPKHTT